MSTVAVLLSFGNPLRCSPLNLGAMAGRALRPTPSTTGDLQPWQITLGEKLGQLHQECFEKRTSLTQTIQQLPAMFGDNAVSEMAYAARVAWNLTPDAAYEKAREILAPGVAIFEGTLFTCPLSWSYADESLWRGLSDNKKIVRLARSMVTTGYRQDEPINSRTFDLTAADGVLAGKLLFGDGQARGLAARLAFQFVLNAVRQSSDGLWGDPEVMRIMQSLIQIPTVFASSTGCSGDDLVVAQAVRQNVKAAMQLPMNAMEWANMVLRSCRLAVGVSAEQTTLILQCMARCTAKYDASLEVSAYDMEPVAKRARRGRRQSAAATARALATAQEDGVPKRPEEPDEDRIKIGSRRLKAISQILGKATPKSFQALQLHLVWAGDYAVSALSDDTLGQDFIWPNSLPPEETFADEATLVARDAAAHSHRDLISKGLTVKPMSYETLLTEPQHEQLVDKITACFEDSALHLTDRNQWLALKPKNEQWSAGRQVIQHWDQTMRSCCQTDLPEEEFKELEKAILYGDAMDNQIMTIIKRFPKTFHIGMIPDMRTTFAAAETDDAAQEQIEAEHAKWQAELRLFKGSLHLDQKLIRTTEVGSHALHDILEWNEGEHVRAQGLIGKSLVTQFTDSHFPKATASSWMDVPGAIAMLVQRIHLEEGTPKSLPRFLAIIDFNTPNARDALKIESMATCVANLFKNFGVERCVLLAHMAAYPKEDSEQDPLEDEVAIMTALRKAGFHAQQRVRMLLQQPATIESTLRVGDWHADSRLCYLSPNDYSARGMVKGLLGNQWRICSELARTTAVVPRPTVPNPAELLHVTDSAGPHSAEQTDSKINKEDKAAQRGPHVAQAYLEALFSKAAVTSTDAAAQTHWIQPGEETWVLDLTAWVGDRAMASLNLMDEAHSKYGTLRHVIVDPGYKRLGQGASFSQVRVANEVASQWMARTRVLHDSVKDQRGNVTRVPRQPLDKVPPPAEDVLKETPGALEAWKGLSALDFKVCAVRGSKIVIAPEKLAAFQHAPLSISEEVRHLETKHREYEDMLAFLAVSPNPNPDGAEKDPRENDIAEPPKTQGEDYVTMESMSALEAFAPGLIEQQAAGDKHVIMYKDDKRKEVWLLSKNDDHIVPKGTILGGFGSGQMGARKQERMDCVPWSLPAGDKTYVQLAAAEEGDTKVKPKVGTFYVVVRPLEKSASQKASPLILTSYGKVQATGSAGKHGYSFEFPDGHAKHMAQDYILSVARANSAKTSNSGNFFASLAIRDGWAGACGLMWRLTHDSVRHNLHARKPLTIAKENIALKKGVPMKVLWLKRGEASLPQPVAVEQEALPIQA